MVVLSLVLVVVVVGVVVVLGVCVRLERGRGGSMMWPDAPVATRWTEGKRGTLMREAD